MNYGKNDDRWEGFRIIMENIEKSEKERKEYVEKTPATLADVENAVNSIMSILREGFHWMNIEDYKFNKK